MNTLPVADARSAGWGAYLRLAKADSLDRFLLPILVGWSALSTESWLSASSARVITLITLGTGHLPRLVTAVVTAWGSEPAGQGRRSNPAGDGRRVHHQSTTPT
ncbi:hypothetical protein [Kitasatospora sp. NPDC088779]|uniref:hypothetical protein n=1 Tax=Kitasatospora sp. NPDC088779 TaxID=3154964 RepID=UPI0034430516